MRMLLSLVCIGLATVASASNLSGQTNEAPVVLIIVGAPGMQEYGESFERSARLWETACEKAGAVCQTIGSGSGGATNDLEQIKDFLTRQPQETSAELWLVLLGHGTFDGKEAKFNLRGPDLSASDLADWLKPMKRPIALIDTSSSSGPFLNKLSSSNRVIVTATRSGYEQNYARFGQFFSAAISDPKADLDKDGQVSILEAFLMSSRQVIEFYKTAGRLATEHAVIDDNGDGRGTPADWFRGTRAVKKASDGASVDGLRAHQWVLLRSEEERKLSPALRERRNQLELSVEQLRESKTSLAEDEYYGQLEKLLLELARLYQSSESGQPEAN